ncbi:MAG: hypothetical protein WD512_15965, partial [Candidatus Paceibacterota bacterium]
DIQLKTYPWTFDTKDAMVDFCKNLFGLDKATDEEVSHGIETYLHPIYVADRYIIEWHLIYFIATKIIATVHPIGSLVDSNIIGDLPQA